MKAAISQLKASLSEYLARVQSGEEVIITDRGKPIARITPLRRDEVTIPDRLRQLERAGIVRIGTGRLPESFWKRARPTDKRGRALLALLEEREEER